MELKVRYDKRLKRSPRGQHLQEKHSVSLWLSAVIFKTDPLEKIMLKGETDTNKIKMTKI